MKERVFLSNNQDGNIENYWMMHFLNVTDVLTNRVNCSGSTFNLTLFWRVVRDLRALLWWIFKMLEGRLSCVFNRCGYLHMLRIWLITASVCSFGRSGYDHGFISDFFIEVICDKAKYYLLDHPPHLVFHSWTLFIQKRLNKILIC